MFSIYSKNIIVIATKHQVCTNLFSQVKQFLRSVRASKQYEINILISNKDMVDGTLIRYNKDDNGLISSIDININNQFHPAVYFLTPETRKTMIEPDKENFELLSYDLTYGILNNNNLTFYDAKIDEENNNITVSYDLTGNLTSIYFNSNVKRCFYKLLNDKQIEELKQEIVEKAVQAVLPMVSEYSSKEGELDFLALEYFFDGEAVDIGLRVGTHKERVEYENKYGTEIDLKKTTGNYKLYINLLSLDDTISPYEELFQYLKRADLINESNISYAAVVGLAKRIRNKLQGINLNKYATLNKDFCVLDIVEYD